MKICKKKKGQYGLVSAEDNIEDHFQFPQKKIVEEKDQRTYGKPLEAVSHALMISADKLRSSWLLVTW
jgi:hypothetical protein